MNMSNKTFCTSIFRTHRRHTTVNTLLLQFSSNKTFKQDRQCTYNVTMMRVRATIVVVARQEVLYRVSLSLDVPNNCQCIQSNSAGFSFVNTGKQVHLKHARRHFERNLVKDVHH